MAIYHLHVQTIGRSAGKSAIAAAAYRSTSRLTDKETGIICDYTKKTKALDCGIMAPLDSPKWVWNREKLWNEVQTKENRKNSQFAWEYDIALPNEVKKRSMINQFCQENFVSKGLVCDYAIHKPDSRGDNRNYHAHIMVTTRKMTVEGWGEKHRVGENKMSDRAEWLKEVRRSWEGICNKELERIGSKERVSCETLEAQGIERIPQRHQGPTATTMERKGVRPDRTKTEQKAKAPSADNDLQPLDFEERLIKEKLRLANLSDEDFKKEYKALDYGQKKAQLIATKNLLPEIEKANKLESGDYEKKIQEFKTQKPSGIASKPNAIKNFFLKWGTDDGKEFSKYEDYAKHQQGLINKWLAKVNPVLEKQKELSAERKLIKEVSQSGDEPAYKLLERQEKRLTLFEKIKEKAQELLDKASEFSGYRNFKNSLEEVREARAVTAQRTQERTSIQAKKKSQEQSRGRSR